MKIGFLFPGQGTQKIGMGKDIYETYKKAREIYELAKKVTGIDVASISFAGEEEILNQTKYTQLAILVMSLAILEILKENKIKAQISAGLSLGEYTALIESGVLSKEDGMKIVQKRGEYMQNRLPAGEWKMAAVFGLSEEAIQEVCHQVKSGFVVPANFNTKEQIVVSGQKEAVEEFEKIAKEKGAKKVRILKTAGPFHTEKLKESAEALRKELETIEIHPFQTKVVKNLDGMPYTQEDKVRDILANHMIHPVRFSKTIETMLAEGVDTFIEIGPGRTLSGFVKKEKGDKEINIFNINDVKSLQDTINLLQNGSI